MPSCVTPTPGSNLSPSHTQWQGLHVWIKCQHPTLCRVMGIHQLNIITTKDCHVQILPHYSQLKETSLRPCLSFQLKPTWFQGDRVGSEEPTTLDNYKDRERLQERTKCRLTPLVLMQHNWGEVTGDPELRKLQQSLPIGKKTKVRWTWGNLYQQLKTKSLLYLFESYRYLWLRTEDSEYCQGHSCK